VTIGQPFNPFGMFNGCFIPEALMSFQSISPGAKLAYARLTRYAGRDGACFPSVTTLASEIGVGERQAQRYLAELEEASLIRRIQRYSSDSGQRSNAIRFLWHPLFEGACESPGGDGSDTGGRSDLSPIRESYEDSQVKEHTPLPPLCVSAKPMGHSPEAAPVKPKPFEVPVGFDSFWAKYPLQDNQNLACQMYLSVVETGAEAAVLACVDRYANSAVVARGVIMAASRWLAEQARNDWRGQWPPRKKTLDELLEEEDVAHAN